MSYIYVVRTSTDPPDTYPLILAIARYSTIQTLKYTWVMGMYPLHYDVCSIVCSITSSLLGTRYFGA